MSLRSIESRVGQRGDLVMCLFELHTHRRAGKGTDHGFRDGSRTSDLRYNSRVHFVIYCIEITKRKERLDKGSYLYEMLA